MKQNKTTLLYPEFDGIIFDMDGTLVDSGQLHQDAWAIALGHFDIPLDFSLMRSLAGVPTYGTVEVLVKHFKLLQIDIDAVAEMKETYAQENFHKYVKPTALAQFAKDNYTHRPMAVGTGASTEEAKQILECCGLSSFIDYVVGADQVEQHKPAPDTFLRCAELLNVPAEKCIVFEDAVAGIKAAKNANMFVVDVCAEMGIVNDYFLPASD